jgi:hypothetical protein
VARILALRREIARLEREVGRLGLGLPAAEQSRGFPQSLATPAREQAETSWSPAPVLGFRMWRLYRQTLRGARRVWPEPYLAAECPQLPGAEPGEVPHRDGPCGRPGCGIYAVPEVPELFRVMPPWYLLEGTVFGLVELSGMVIEHERGYRAAHARVVAVVVGSLGRIVTSDDAAWIESLFRRPADVLCGPAAGAWAAATRTPLDDEEIRQAIVGYLEAQRRRRQDSWT